MMNRPCWTMLLTAALLLHGGIARAYERRTPVVEAVEKVGPAVVSVVALAEVTEYVNPFFRGSPRELFDFFQGRRQLETRKREKEVGLGSGVVVDPEGYVLTNHHVVAGGQYFRLEFADGRVLEASLVGADDELDIAVLKTESENVIPYVRPGVSEDLMIGETVIAIGNPFGLSHTVTTGVISAIGRDVQADNRVYHDFLQTDASINPGNSGGPLLDINGELIGINTAIRRDAEGIGFAIPIDRARRIYESLIHLGSVQLAWTGLYLQDLTPELREAMSYPKGAGVLVTDVDEDSPAAKAGIKRGDILEKLGSKPLKDTGTYFDQVRTYTIADTLSITLWRGEEEMTAAFKGAKLTDEKAAEISWRMLGLKMEPSSAALVQRHRLSVGDGMVVTEVARGSQAEKIGLKAGDVVRQLGGRAINTREQLSAMVLRLQAYTQAVLLVIRGPYGYYVTIPFARS